MHHKARRKVQKFDVLVATVRPNLQSHLIVRQDVTDVICSTGFSVIRCDPNAVSAEYIYHHIFGDVVEKQFNAIMVGSNYPAINSKDVKNLSIPLPQLLEQQTIAEVLSDMDAEIETLERQRNKTRALKQGMMQELLTGQKRLR